MGMLGHMVVLFLVFKGISILFSIVAVSVCIPTNSAVSSVQFSCAVVSDSLRPHESQHARPPCPSRTAFIVCRFFGDGHSERCEVISRAMYFFKMSHRHVEGTRIWFESWLYHLLGCEFGHRFLRVWLCGL